MANESQCLGCGSELRSSEEWVVQQCLTCQQDNCPLCGKADQSGELCEECMITQTEFAIDEVG